jgi:hypothetical protein
VGTPHGIEGAREQPRIDVVQDVSLAGVGNGPGQVLQVRAGGDEVEVGLAHVRSSFSSSPLLSFVPYQLKVEDRDVDRGVRPHPGEVVPLVTEGPDAGQ